MPVITEDDLRRPRAPRVFIEFGSYHSLNFGDLAMLEVVVGRLRERCPEAVIEVTNAAPERLARVCPDVIAVLPEPSEGRGSAGYVPSRMARATGARRHGTRPGGLRGRLAAKAARPPFQRPWTAAHLQVLDALRRADVVLVSGGGAMTDAFLPHPLMILDRLEVGALRGSVTAMVGQGIGPVEDPALMRRMEVVLPKIDLIAVREPRKSDALLQTAGVGADRLRMTGDDAVELALNARRSRGEGAAANGVGVNLRISPYSGVTKADAEMVAEVLRDHAASHAAHLVPVPISMHPGESDAQTLRSMLGGDGGAALETPAQIIERVGGCRVVVTGSYHAAVFALAQGIPAVGISASGYYADKFGGLAALFPGGCDVVVLDEPQPAERLAEAVTRSWRDAGRIRPALLSAAQDQVAAGRAAFDHVAELIDRRMTRQRARSTTAVPQAAGLAE